MKRWNLRIIAVAAIINLFTLTVIAADTNAPANKKPADFPISMRGTVNVTKDSGGKVTGLKLITPDKVSHDVVLDKEGSGLVKMDGKEVIAQVIQKDGVLKVVSYKAGERLGTKTPRTKARSK